MNKWAGWAIAAVLIAGAWVSTQFVAPPTAWRTPYVTEGEVGQAITSGNLEVTVLDATFVDTLHDTVYAGTWVGEGNWLVLDISAQLVTDETVGGLLTDRLILGGAEYSASERPSSTMRTTPLSITMAKRGVLVFELPPGVRDGLVRVQIGNGDATRAGQVAEVSLDLSELAHVAEMTLDAPRWEAAP